MQLRTTIALALIGTPPNSTTEEKRDRVFISYSHRDKRFLEMLEEHLKPLRRKGIDIWSDTRIHPGSEWRLEIETQLRRCRIAVMLVSASFLASDFIANNELPPLLEAAKREGATILYVVVRPCKIPIELSKYQALHSFAKSLSELSNAERDRIWMALSDWIEAII
jgi:hypothetical protein